jgi:hypothetical protein
MPIGGPSRTPIDTADVASVKDDPGRIVYCCLRGDHFRLSYHLYDWKQSVQAIGRKLEEMAAGLSSGLTKHTTAVDRARAAVATVNKAMEVMADQGELREFKAARKVDPAIRYQDYLHSRKAAMLEAIAREANR